MLADAINAVMTCNDKRAVCSLAFPSLWVLFVFLSLCEEQARTDLGMALHKVILQEVTCLLLAFLLIGRAGFVGLESRIETSRVNLHAHALRGR